MPKLCAVTAPGSRAENIFVNPTLVRVVRSGSPGTSVIIFDHDHSLPVTVPIDLVRARLDQAMNES